MLLRHCRATLKLMRLNRRSVKRRAHTRYLGILLLLMTSALSQVVVAEIYKWVDADGKIHYGDKPRDAAQAREAQQIQLRESYQPAERTAQEQQAYDEEQRLISLRDQMRRSEEQQARDEAEAKQREEKKLLCENYEDAIRELSTVQEKNGVPTWVYLQDEDGKSVSSQRQLEIIEEIKTKSTAAGCT
jgi:Domain of unknown function (DUF4124)